MTDRTLGITPFSILPATKSSRQVWPVRALVRGVESALGLSALNRMYEQWSWEQGSAEGNEEFGRAPFGQDALRVLNIRVELVRGSLDRLPSTGSLLITSNHPFGAVEGLALESLVRKVRSDVKVLSNHLLARISEVHASSIFVDPFGSPAARFQNMGPLRKAIRWLKDGHVLIVFPAGEVASFDLRARCVVEPRWQSGVVRLALRSKAVVMPVYIEGRNPFWFHAAGVVHPRLRTALLPRTLLHQIGTTIQVRIGTGVSAERLERFPHANEAARYLRLRTLLLGTESSVTKARGSNGIRGFDSDCDVTASAPPAVDPVNQELAALPNECLLLEDGSFQVYVARSQRIPHMLEVIGRMREVTFRAVGEGTGKALDLDRFDADYLHLFCWDRRAQRLVGAYRLGFTQELLGKKGVDALYTQTLFRYDVRLLEEMGPSIELGRSFITRDYQRSYSALLLLWKGIARIVARNPECRNLFGVVSISAEYDSMTRQLLMAFLRLNNFDDRLARWVTPRTPPKVLRRRESECVLGARVAEGIDEVDELVREIEANQRSIPILLRQYLRLNGRVLGFNIDSQFGNVLDALMLVDLVETPRSILNRFFGREQAEAFLACHAASPASVGQER